jgi:hypothetical protein
MRRGRPTLGSLLAKTPAILGKSFDIYALEPDIPRFTTIS